MPKAERVSKSQDPGKEMRLIELIRENPEIYDPGHPNAKDNNQKRIIWGKISAEMNTPVDRLKKIWRKLRSRYTRRCRDIELNKMAKTASPWDEALAFLTTSALEYAKENNDCCNGKAIANNKTKAGDDVSSSQLSSISEEGSRSRSAFALETGGDSAGSATDRVLRPRHSATQTTPGNRSSFKNGRKHLQLDPSDSTRLFFESMTVKVASFPQYLQAVVKLQICKIVSGTECELSSPNKH